MKIVIETTVAAPKDRVWLAWTTPEHIKQWNAASDDWHTTAAEVDLREGGKFTSRMEAKDGSMGFDFAGTFTGVAEFERIEYALEDSRVVLVEFETDGDGVRVRETFDADPSHSAEMQQSGWQAILNNFKRHVEAL